MSNVRRLRRPAGSAATSGRRLRANWPAELKVGGGRAACTVVDVSGAGANLRISHVPEQALVWLMIENLPPIAASVAWREGGHTGLAFAQEQEWVLNLSRQRFNPAAWIEN
jgi:hypothetical protein